MTIHSILFTEEAVHIEYTGRGSGPFTKTSQVAIPFRDAQRFPQLAQDLQELMDDADTLLSSVQATMASGTPQFPREMGRE